MNLQGDMFPVESGVTVLGLDLSLSATGITVLGPGEGPVLHSTTIGYDLKKNCMEQERLDRLVNLVVGVDRVIEEHRPSVIGIEGYAFSAKFGGERLAELHGVLKVHIYQKWKKIPVIVPPKRARKVVLGYGGHDKKRVQAAAKKMMDADVIPGGARLMDHNQIDAYIIAEFVRRRHGQRD